MRKVLLSILIGVLILAISNPIAAKSKGKKINEPVDKITFIHYKGGKVRVEGKGAKAQTCYKLLGVKWRNLPIDYVIQTGIPESAISLATAEWDRWTSANLFGNFATDSLADFDEDSPDGKNEYSIGNYPEEGVIAVTNIWYTIRSKQIVEYDVLFDTDYLWGDATINPEVMDWQNIATHETGHGLGLGDVYQTLCSEVTMYGYSDYGETKKRTLETPDILGLQKLYGGL